MIDWLNEDNYALFCKYKIRVGNVNVGSVFPSKSGPESIILEAHFFFLPCDILKEGISKFQLQG